MHLVTAGTRTVHLALNPTGTQTSCIHTLIATTHIGPITGDTQDDTIHALTTHGVAPSRLCKKCFFLRFRRTYAAHLEATRTTTTTQRRTHLFTNIPDQTLIASLRRQHGHPATGRTSTGRIAHAQTIAEVERRWPDAAATARQSPDGYVTALLRALPEAPSGTIADVPVLDATDPADRLAIAFKAGIAACRADRPDAPATDPTMRTLLHGLPVGGGAVPLLTAWRAGYAAMRDLT